MSDTALKRTPTDYDRVAELDALMIEVAREVEKDGKKFKKLQVMCDALVDEAIAGSVEAFKVIADRIDGKVDRFED